MTYTRTGLGSALALACLAGCQATPEPALITEQTERYTIEDFLDTTSMFGASFSPDEQRILVSSDQSGVFNAYAVPASGDEAVPLTASTEQSIFAASYFPHDERFIYTSDEGGNELNHVFVRELDGTTVDLTPGEGHKASFLAWAHDEQSFFVSTNERDQRYFDVYEISVDGYSRAMVYENTEGYDFSAISRDKRFIALNKTHTRTDTDVHLYDRQTGEMRLLTPDADDDEYNSAQAFTADGRGLYLLTDQGGEFRRLVSLDLESGRRTTIVDPGWDVWYAELSRSGRYLVIGINRDARTEVQVLDSSSLKPLALPSFPYGDVVSVELSRSEEKLAFYLAGSRSPGNLYLYDLANRGATELTRNLSARIRAADLVEAEVVRFRSYDDVEIPGLLYKPHDATADNPAPALVWVHGGPGGQSRIGYRALIQYLVNGGYVVYAINNRGSSGYGRSFFLMDDRSHGSADLDDCVASKQFLIDLGYVDPDRVGIIGGSYGGYMVLAALAFRPEVFAIGVDIFGVSNWVRTLESIPAWWETFREALYKEMGHPVDDHDHLYAISPLFHASNIIHPLLVLQGANDPRVLKAESDEIVEAVRANGVEVEYIVFDDEGHGFRKKANQSRGYRAIRDFCDRHLGGD